MLKYVTVSYYFRGRMRYDIFQGDDASMNTAPHLFTVDSVYANQRLDNFLLARLKGVPKSCLYRLLRQGKIRVNKKRQKPSYRIQGEDNIRLPRLSICEAETTLIKPSFSLRKQLLNAILFENDAFFIMNKPDGLAVHGGSGITLGLIESLRQIYPTLPHLELVHRLDRETSGCLLVAKKPSILKKLHALFREKKIKKTYLMLTKGHWPNQLTKIDMPLQKNQLQSGERMVQIHSEGQSALTQFIVHKHFKETSLVEATPRTGRTHQIRVHAQYVEHPIVGDEKYGDKSFNQLIRVQGLKRLFLHAHALRFTDPHTGEVVHVKAPLPPELETILERDI